SSRGTDWRKKAHGRGHRSRSASFPSWKRSFPNQESLGRAPRVHHGIMRFEIIVLAFFVAAPAASADPDKAKALFLEGQGAFNAGRFDAAATAFELAFAESPRAQLLWNLAQARRKQYEIDRNPINLRKACVVYAHYAELTDDEDGRREATEAKMVCEGAIN